MHLDSFFYRLLWKLNCFLRIKNSGPPPIVWGKPRIFDIPSNLLHSIDKNDQKHLELIKKELMILSRIYNYIPEKISINQWISLMELKTPKARFEYVNFLRQKELRSKKDEKRKLLKFQTPIVDENVSENSCDRQNILYISPEKRANWNQQIECKRYINCLLFENTPKLIIDCRFIGMHSFRGMNLAFKQLIQVASENRRRLDPWPLYFVNFDIKNNPALEKGCKKHLSILNGINSLTINVTSKSYIDLFPQHYAKKQLIYLSPHTGDVLTQIDPNACYIIGGIVDRVHEPNIPLKASIRTAEQEDLKCFRLPIDEHLDWKNGNKMLTIPSVASILQDVYTSNDWEKTLKTYVPIRKLQDSSKKNPLLLKKYKNLALFKNEIVRILNKKTPVK